ncbi:MAG: polysaccharide deacetylase family protein [Pirellulaceae bacterium]|nr:polysaccharide deacetylase family protein [Pirellulaceae bacterium]
MPRPLASLSLDLDNKWSYLKTHGDPGWESFPSYLEVVVPRFLGVLEKLGLRITVFVVGQDAALDKNHAALRAIPVAGHEIGNHSFHHEPWLHRYSLAEIELELATAEDAIAAATGVRPTCFRGPGYSLSADVLRVLVRRGYQFDASTFPTFLGPLARAYYFFTARLSREQQVERKRLFGEWTEGFRPLRPYQWQVEGQKLLEIPVTTLPFARVPIHVSYLLYLRQFSRAAAWAYWRLALGLCRATGIGPSLLLHPLDFLGGDDEPDLAFFPAMRMKGSEKTEFAASVLAELARQFDVVPMSAHAQALSNRGRLAIRPLPPDSAKQVEIPRATATEQSAAAGG